MTKVKGKSTTTRKIDRNLPAVYEGKLKREKELPAVSKKIKRLEKDGSQFALPAKKIQALIDDNNNDGAITLTQKALLKMMIDLIPLAEQKVRESDSTRGIYQINALVSQARELIADIQSNRDQAMIVDTIMANIIQPNMVSITQFIVDSQYQLKREIQDKVKTEHVRDVSTAIDMSARSIAAYMSEIFKVIRARLEKDLID